MNLRTLALLVSRRCEFIFEKKRNYYIIMYVLWGFELRLFYSGDGMLTAGEIFWIL